MPLNSNSFEQKSDFTETMAELSEKQLVEVLKKRSLYQEAAAKQAVREAIKRGIIHTEDDLLGTEYREKRLKRQLFPEIEDEKIRNKIRRSISRGFLLSGSLPAILSVIRLTRGNFTEGALLLAFAVIWMGTSAWMFQQFSRAALVLLVVLFAVSFFYTLKLLLAPFSYSIMDKFIVVILYLLIAYGLMYLNRLAHK